MWLLNIQDIYMYTHTSMKVKVKVAQQCLTLCDPMVYTVHGILQFRIWEWVAFPFSRGSCQPRDQTQVSCIAGGFFTSHKGSPRILAWLAYPFSSIFSWPRNWTRVSCIAGGFLTNCATREAYINTHTHTHTHIHIYIHKPWEIGKLCFLW